MKFRITFKTPDAVNNVIKNTIELEGLYNLLEDAASLENEMHSIADEFVMHGECITVEFDTEKGTATVVGVNNA